MNDLFGRSATPAPAKESTDNRYSHVCAIEGCRAPAHFGFDVFRIRSPNERWSCRAHREEVRKMKASDRSGVTTDSD